MAKCEYCNDSGARECPSCYGSGAVDCPLCDLGDIDCPSCSGKGNVICPDCNGTGEISDEDGTNSCSDCFGTGYIDCVNCGGTGYVIDACALIDAAQNYNMSKKTFAHIWETIDQLIEKDELISSAEIMDELKDEDLKIWAKRHHKCFLPLTKEVQEKNNGSSCAISQSH